MPQPMDTFLITLTPRQLPALQRWSTGRGWRSIPALLAYRLGSGPHLLRADNASLPRGALMVVGDRGFDGLGQTSAVCQEILQECQSRGFSGAILDFEGRIPPLEQIAARLDGPFAQRGLALYVSERYGAAAPHAQVMIPSSLSGGSLRQRLEEARERFGRDRVVLALERVAEDFFLPSPTGSGQPLSPEQLARLMDRLEPAVFFSGELCARYLTYMSRETGAHFVLFDDADTLRCKLEVARSLSIHTFLAPWAEVADCAAGLGIRHSSPVAGRATSSAR